MTALVSELAPEMYWLQPEIGTEYFELHAAAGVLETLHCKRSLFDETVTVSSTFGEWILKPEGVLLWPKIVVTAKDGDAEIATYWQKFLDYGRLEFASGNKFAWNIQGFWIQKKGFVNEKEEPLFWMVSGAPNKKFSDLFRRQATVEMQTDGYRYQGTELSILLALGWYLMILDARSDGATAGLANAG